MPNETIDLRTDHMPLNVECSYSNISEEWTAEANHEKNGTSFRGKGKTRPDALRALADALESYG